MAVYAPAKCNKCGTEFTISGGDGWLFTVFKCEDCGYRKAVNYPSRQEKDVKLAEAQISSCEKCGGKLSKTAPDRCPQCGSLDYTVDDSNRYAID